MVLPDQDSGLPVAPEEIVAPEDIYEPEGDQDSTCPPMASGSQCYKNWDRALLQNCTNVRLKVIANDYESVGSARSKLELYRVDKIVSFYKHTIILCRKCYRSSFSIFCPDRSTCTYNMLS